MAEGGVEGGEEAVEAWEAMVGSGAGAVGGGMVETREEVKLVRFGLLVSLILLVIPYPVTSCSAQNKSQSSL